MKITRQSFLQLLAGVITPPLGFTAISAFSEKSRKYYMRPPGALEESEFLKKCIRCTSCANVCPNQCITFYALDGGLKNFGTPRINARAKGCILCMKCTDACPTGALKPTRKTKEGIASVNMGKAYIATDICYSYAGRTCGVCYRACPLPGKALTVDLYEVPKVNLKYCVGCGLCENSCIHMPQAIRIIPASDLKEINA